MIEAENLTRYYGSTRAVYNISFHVDKGEIVGFLGPNGAGKTTTMRMLTGFLPPSDGTARVAGFLFGRRRFALVSPVCAGLYYVRKASCFLDDRRNRLGGIVD